MTETTLERLPHNGPPMERISQEDAALMERVLLTGDLAKLEPQERCAYYFALCRSLKLNPMSRPFEYLNLQGKLVLYARKDCAEQLRRLHNVSIIDLRSEISGDLCIVTATARMPNGRTDMDQGAVTIAGLRGEALANAQLKALTKSKRRVTLSLCGLGMLDEAEVETIPGARTVTVDERTGEIREPRPALPPPSDPFSDHAPAPEIQPPPARPAAGSGPTAAKAPAPAPGPREVAKLEYGKLAYRAGKLGIKPPSLTNDMTAEEIGEMREILEASIESVERERAPVEVEA